MTGRYDVVIAGGGPSGSAAAWQAAQSGARVAVLDKAEFPRDKPCGDGLTARAVSYLQKMGLADEVATYHRVNRVTVFSPSEWELTFPRRPGMPDHGHTVSRTHLDTVLLKHAESAGAEVYQGAEVAGPELDARGRVVGVVLKSGEKVLGDAVIAADGAYSPIKRALKLDSQYNGYSAIAIRSEMNLNRPDNDSLDIYLKLLFQGDQLPGYGWVFPMGGSRFNIGLGYVNSYKNWQSINATQFLGDFLRTLPAEWEVPPIEELKKNKSVRAWRLPMGFTAWPPWRPGVLFAGDALGAGKPVSGAGISKALESGLTAGECAVAALVNGGPDDFTNYEQRMRAAWGREYRRGRFFNKLAGNPAIASAGLKALDNRTFRDLLLKSMYKKAQSPQHT
ncbi:geranylgeranyl reductase family protein [Mycolicibacterium diernhoferi]|uniref:Geranylgeranyl reductase n=1 Tax=Mycolicibacterium diernhoferi TaxID=1801 RepID=A0A1Q4HG85_9MYCO|nr:geranylgeranyl reductase family protein [Mycolicibacterium diernhoferi]OJZ66442.1 geranylgeranyl reductase [Mycolicibacterium diernhoferi]OPE56356.1 geranylgeranyl reductase [Mycolicibacterium diernhoferi]PEG56318.1 geranylgeranyl reductase [Mycolicibacterium diernhoferi]QYL24615.1 geranylgeranyl reductase family protein [Mycolicibacterium diernhoferi]